MKSKERYSLKGKEKMHKYGYTLWGLPRNYSSHHSILETSSLWFLFPSCGPSTHCLAQITVFHQRAIPSRGNEGVKRWVVFWLKNA